MFGKRKSTAGTVPPPTTTTTRRSHPKPLLRTLLSAIRTLILLLSLYLLGLFIYLIVEITRSNTGITETRPNRETLAILIISGASSLWALFSFITTCFGHTKTGLVMVIVDLLYMGAFIGVSILLKSEGYRNCRALFPSGGARRDCNLLRAAFSFAIVLAVLYFLAMLLSALLARAFRKSRAYGPGPDNGYSAGNNPPPRGKHHRRRDEEIGYIPPMTSAPVATHGHHNRHSAMTDNTQYTGNTVVGAPGTDSYNEVKLNDPNTVRGAGMRAQTPVGGYEPYRKPVHERGLQTEGAYANDYDNRTGRF